MAHVTAANVNDNICLGRAATAEDRNNAAGGEAITMWLRIVATVDCRTSGKSATKASR